MATILLGALGSAIGSSIGGSILGIGAAAIGKAVGASIGRAIDQSVVAMLTPDEQIKGPEVGTVGMALPREGDMLARGVGWQKLPARIIWPENLHFSEESETVSTGGKGAQNKSSTTTYYAEVSIAVAIRDGETDLLGRVWADGNLVDLSGLCNSVTGYKGTATQDPDPTLEAVDGAGNVPDWRGVTYLVLEGFNLSSFGNRIPQLEFETFTATSAEPQAFKGISLMATAGEFGLDPVKVTERVVETVEESGGPEEIVIEESPVNNNAVSSAADIVTALDLLAVQHPQITQVLIEYPWFGDDLRCGNCQITPRVEMAARETAPDTWMVEGIARGAATIVSQVDGAGAFAGTPSDTSVIRLIGELRARGYEVALSPRILMDIPAGNGLDDPYGGAEQAAYPDRGKITCHPAIGQPGTVDKTASAATQVDAFFGTAAAADFTIAGQVVSYAGPSEWSYRRFVLHCAALVQAAGGIDTLLLGSGLSGLTKIRSDASTFPVVDQLVALLAEVRNAPWGVFTPAPPLVYTVPSPGDGVALPLKSYYDNLHSDIWTVEGNTIYAREGVFNEGGVDFAVGEDGYLIESATGTATNVSVDFPVGAGNWYVHAAFEHAKSPGTTAGSRGWGMRPFTDGVGVFGADITAAKSFGNYPTSGLVNWTPEAYGGVITDGSDYVRFFYRMTEVDRLFRDLQITINRLVEIGYAADWQEYGAYVPDDGSGDVLFPLDPLWAANGCDFVGINYQPPLADIRDGDASSIYDLVALKAAIESGEHYDWLYYSEADRQSRTRTDITDAVEGEPWVFRRKDIYNWWNSAHHARPLGVRDAGASAWIPASKPVRLYYGCPAIDRAANQPTVEVNPNASAVSNPHFSNGARDDESQATYIRAIAEYWAADARGVVDAEKCCVTGWDARPWPVFPHSELWPDAAAWPTGFSIAGRRIIGLASWLADELAYRGLDYSLGQVTGAVDGITIDNLAGFMAIAAPVLDLFQLDASEIGGKITITSRMVQVPTDTIDLEAIIPLSKTDRFRAPRASTGSLPAIAYLTHRDVGHEYDVNTVNSRLDRIGNGESRAEVPVLLDPQRGRDLIRVKHLDGTVALDTLECELPPSWLPKLAPGRAVAADAGLGLKEWLILKRDVGEGIKISARRLDREALRPNPTKRVGYKAPRVAASGATSMAMADLPWIASSDPVHDLRAAIWVDPAQGNALMRSLSESTGYASVGQFTTRATMGVLTSDLAAGSIYGWDRGNTISLRLFSGSLVTRSEPEVRAGENWLAVRTDAAANTWEVIAFRDAALAGSGAYDLSHLLRGLRGSQVAANVAAGALVVLIKNLPFAGLEIDNVGAPYWWSAGPSALARTDPRWITRQVTPLGVGLKPFAPTRLTGKIVSGDLELAWRRQDRDPRADQLDRASIPMSEDTLAFAVTIGASTWNVSSESATIAAASLPAAPYQITVQQVSADVGLGYPATLTME